MKRQIYDLFRIPYYRALISKHGDVVGTRIVKMKGNLIDFTFQYGKRKLIFTLPRDKELQIPPLKLKSGRLVVYDINSPIPMRLVSQRDEGIDWMDEELRVAYKISPKQYYLTPNDSRELNDYLESRTVQDILSDNEKEIPWWIVAIVVSVVAAIGLIAVVFLITHAPPTVIEKFIQANVTAIPTMYMIPGV